MAVVNLTGARQPLVIDKPRVGWTDGGQGERFILSVDHVLVTFDREEAEKVIDGLRMYLDMSRAPKPKKGKKK